jgi:hypothetical protein
LLNALDLQSRNYDVKIVMEGASTKLISDLRSGSNPLSGLYKKVKAAGLIDAVCKACASKMNVLEEARSEGLPIVEDMSGHPSLARYVDKGYQIITF